MRELTVRALVHSAALGNSDAADGARLLSAVIENAALTDVVATLDGFTSS